MPNGLRVKIDERVGGGGGGGEFVIIEKLVKSYEHICMPKCSLVHSFQHNDLYSSYFWWENDEIYLPMSLVFRGF